MRQDFLPFGEETPTGTGGRSTAQGYVGADSIRQTFTGYERDAETDLDFAQARMYHKNHGRFTSSDEPFLDQWEENPQSWNLYIYVRNNPLNLIDPLGMKADCPPGSPDGCYERDGDYFYKDENGNEIGWDPIPIVIHVTAPSCDKKPCRLDLPESKQDWIPVWGSFRRMLWNMKCTGAGGCNVDKALYYFGMTALEATPVGWFFRGAQAARAAPSILKTLCFEEGTLILTEDGLKPIEEIEEGDKVLSYNEKTKQTEYKMVVQTMVRFAEAGRILSLKIEGEAKALG